MANAQNTRIEKKIEKLKKVMRQEKQQWGGYHDGRGLRYSIAELYFKLGDPKKTNRYISWFDKTFPGDSTYPYFQSGVALAKFELNKISDCKERVIGINKHNTYLIDLILEKDVKDQNKYEWIESETLRWAEENVNAHKEILTLPFINWLREFVDSDEYQTWFRKYLSIKKLLKGMEVSEERSNLLSAERKCIQDWKRESGNTQNTK